MSNLFNQPLNIINIGLARFAEDLIKQSAKVYQLDWQPAGGGNLPLIKTLTYLEQTEIAQKIDLANQEAFQRITQASPVLIGYGKAKEVIPGMQDKMLLHAGPPINWEKMNGPMRGAITGAIVFEGWAKNLTQAEELAASGEIKFSPCHEHQAVGSMTGVTSPSMYVHIVENKTHGNFAFTNLSEQLAKILRMGANDQSVIDRLNWMRDILGPMLAEAMTFCDDGIDLRLMLSQALHMGDECHNRNIAGTVLLNQKLTPYILETHFSNKDKKDVFNFIASSDYFSGPTWMVCCKAALDAAQGIPYSTVLTTMARNGTEFGIRVAGLPNQWFTGPAQQVIGPMFAGYKPEDSGLDVGDSAITETYGIGGFAMAAAPAIVSLVGGTVKDAIRYSKTMNQITIGNNPNITIPSLNFMGIPTGIDIRKVVENNLLPVINTAIAHKDAGIGMIGAGIVHPPMEAFQKALFAFGQTYVK
ncbi:DUF1116 domain-containing protein [Avibacterium paragallinarum]|uniref:DUF1116 domain-containing protein n=1 Tax=Avibacterium paragallinarum TaxID=728 RepID=UPI0021F7EFA4|nr:DUF1116 domain-containing protein [Avibacterium paragallinarum]UXN34956.1 DUF1116 domain-containing protein [Avibacterium paragallinarum]